MLRRTGWLEQLKPYRRSPRRLATAALLAVVITGALLTALWQSGLDFPEMALLDARFRARGRLPAPPDILIAALDDRTINGRRRLSPVPRDLLALIVRRLADEGAKTIVLDVGLPDRLAGDEDEKLRDAMVEAGNVILPAVIDDRRRLARPYRSFEDAAAAVGLAHAETAAVDHIVRWFRPVDHGMPAMALVASAHFTGRLPEVSDLLSTHRSAALARWMGQRLDGQGRLLINFAGPPRSIPRISAGDLLERRLARGTVPGKLVLVGATWSGVQDVQFTPFAHWGADSATSLMTGVEVQANCVATLLAQPRLRPAAPEADALCLLGTVLAVSLIAVFFPPTAAALLSLILAALWIAAGFHLFTRQHLFVPLAPPLAGIVLAYLTSALVTERRAHHLRRHFRRYVGRPIADQIADMSDAEIGRMGRERVVTLLFSDIRGYTRFSSNLPPDAIVRFLNRYFERMTTAALAHNGFVDKYLGDGLMAIFGMFDSDESGAAGAADAVRAALAMRGAADALRRNDPEFREIAIGIGLHTGRVVVGDLGPPERSDFTAIGSPVNLASRIEGETKAVLETHRGKGKQPAAVILMSHVTHSLVAARMEATPLGPTTIRGLEDEEVQLWELKQPRPGEEPGEQTIA